MSAIVAPDQIRQGFSSAVPEPGQLVEVRRRQWVVGDVQGASIDRETEAASWQHLVNLTSIDEDALGEELDVVWEIEPGARVLEKAGLPRITGHDDADRLEAFLDAVSWGAATNADRSFLQAPFRSGVTIEDYQLDPLVRAIDMARVNLLIADDVGLGKTIEAGLVIQELLVRHRARTVLIVCPASLQVKWQMEMHEKFGLEFRIVDTDYIRRLRRERGIHANPWTSFPRLVTSMDWMKSGEGLRLMKDVLPPHATYPRKFDVLVVDEAHNVAPAAAAQYALESQRTRLIRAIAPHFEHRLFLSATPHNGYQESFTSLLELLDDQRFARSVMPDERQLQRVMVRRLKTDLVDADGKPIYPRRELMPLEVEYTPEEREMHRLLREYTESRARSVGGTRSEFGADFVHKLLKKRLFSSPAAFAATLSKHRESLERGPATKSGKAMEDRILRKAILRAEEDWADDGRLEVALDDATREAGATAPTLTTEQRDMLDRLGRWAESAKNKPDSKARAILNWLDAYLKTDGHWNDRRVILFTEYRATHAWLHQILASHGYGSDRIAILHGGMDGDERERIKAAFQAHPSISESVAKFPLPLASVSQAGIDAAARFNDISVVWSADRGCGLTEVMNAIHSPDTNDERIVELRSLLETIDAEIAAAYGWHGLDLEHGFRQIQGATNNDRWRHAVSEATRAEILNRLSELNRERYEEEVARGLSENATRRSSARAPRTRRGAEESTQATLDLGMPSAATASAGDSVVYAASANESDYLEAAESRARYTAMPADAILDFLSSSPGWHAKSDIVAATGLSDGQWNTLIADLIARGLVERQGERRGARYRLVE